MRLKLENGMVVSVPDDTVIVEETFSANSKYAGIIAVRGGGYPHYLILSEKPITEITCEEEEAVYDKVGCLYSELAEARKKQVDPILGDDGFVILNAKEYLASPRLGLFSIPVIWDTDRS